nr:MAG TPA: hypothetical protein [Caudoviricetes sp.]
MFFNTRNPTSLTTGRAFFCCSENFLKKILKNLTKSVDKLS